MLPENYIPSRKDLEWGAIWAGGGPVSPSCGLQLYCQKQGRVSKARQVASYCLLQFLTWSDFPLLHRPKSHSRIWREVLGMNLDPLGHSAQHQQVKPIPMAGNISPIKCFPLPNQAFKSESPTHTLISSRGFWHLLIFLSNTTEVPPGYFAWQWGFSP